MKLTSKGNPIDTLVLEGLKTKGIGFAPEADRATLARRAALVLTGLPPEPEQLQRFLKDPRPGASVTAKVHCGRRSIGYVWLHDLFEWFQSRVLFHIR